MRCLVTLHEALILADSLPTSSALFLPGDEEWSLDTPCAILEVDPYDGSDVPLFAREHGLAYALSADQVQDVVDNAREQVATPTPEQVLAALRFYYDRDAFIVLGEGGASGRGRS
jgi:hypothetical protein